MATTEKEREFLRKYADLCKEYDMVLESESPSYGLVLVNGDWAKNCGQETALKAFNTEMNVVQNGLVYPREYIVGHKVVFRDTNEAGLITGAYVKFGEGYDFEAMMEDGTVRHFTDNDNFYTV